MPLDAFLQTTPLGLARVQAFFTALPLAFGLLHLLLFAALPRLRSHLYYGLFLVFIAGTIYADFQEHLAPFGSDLLLLRLQRGGLTLAFVFAVRFFYEVFLDRAPPQFRYLAAALLATGALAVAAPGALFWPLQLVLVVGLGESVRAMAVALRRHREGARLIAFGFVCFVAFALYDLLLDFGLIPAFGGVDNAYQFGLVGLFVATSASLARGIAATSRQLVAQERRGREQEVERRLLAAEVERTRGELEEARALQLSLLPEAVPERPGLRVAAFTRTAAEVGGDYYDFREGADGTLTVAVGDATGHGLRAGFMVAVAKSLFLGLRDDEALPAFFERCTRALKPMRLGNLYMGLTVARLRGGALTVAAAGMPPLLVYRARRGAVERVTLKGMPLGAFFGFPYEEARLGLDPGDAVLLTTDGLEETFDAERAMLGMERVERAFAEAAGGAPEAVVARLVSVADAWRGPHPQHDDVTLVVLQRA